MRAGVICAAVLISGCARGPADVELRDPVISVHAVLSAGSDSALVLITSAVSSSDFASSTNVSPVTGARVHIQGPGFSAELIPDSSADRCRIFDFDQEPLPSTRRLRTGCYVGLVRGGIRARETYQLDVLLPDGKRVSGSTTVPEPLAVLSPSAGARLIGDSRFRIAWRSAVPSPDILLGLLRMNPNCQAGLSVDEPTTRFAAADSIDAQVTNFLCRGPNALTMAEAELVVSAIDSSYARYVNQFRNRVVTPAHASFGLVGALGLFGSEASVRIPVVIARGR